MKYILTILTLLPFYYSMAQGGFFIMPSAGYGFSNIAEKTIYIQPGQKTNTGSYIAEFKLGYSIGNIRFSTGLNYFRTGYCRKKYTLIYVPTSSTPVETDAYSFFSHLGIPLQIGSVIPVYKKLSLYPTIGTDITYNLGEKIAYRNSSGKTSFSINSKEFYSTYNKISLFATATVNMEYAATDQLHVIFSPSARYMLGDFLRKPVNLSQHSYGIYMNAGIIFFPRRKQAQTNGL
jgi:hypothetical protein